MSARFTRWHAAGLSLLLAGLLAMGGAAWVYSSAVKARGDAAARLDRSRASCLSAAQKLGKGTLVEGGAIEMSLAPAPEPRLAMADTAALAALCQGWKISQWCMGEDCGRPGLAMVVRLAPPK